MLLTALLFSACGGGSSSLIDETIIDDEEENDDEESEDEEDNEDDSGGDDDSGNEDDSGDSGNEDDGGDSGNEDDSGDNETGDDSEDDDSEDDEDVERDSLGAIETASTWNEAEACGGDIPGNADTGVGCIDTNYSGEWGWRGGTDDLVTGLNGPRGVDVAVWGDPVSLSSLTSDDETYAMGNKVSENPHDPIGAIGARHAYSLGLTGAGVTVAVVDTPIYAEHSELEGKVVAEYDICKVENDSSCAPDDLDELLTQGNHGTHVAGIIGAKRDSTQMHGVAYDANLVSLAFTERWNGGLSVVLEDLADGITGAVGEGARVFNNSWGSSSLEDNSSIFDDSTLRAAAADAIEQGSVFVWAAGNSYSENTDLGANNTSQEAKAALKHAELMGGFVNVVNLVYDNTAGAWVISNELEGSDQQSNSQICGVTMNYCLGAPGTNIYSSVGVDGVYDTYSGTSMAAPMVSGGIAILFQAFPYVETSDILDLLFATAEDLGAQGVDEVYGHGMMNLAAALEPSGSLTLATSSSTETNTGVALTGASLLGDSAFVGAISAAANDMVALDAFDRAYTVGAMGMTALSDADRQSATALSDSLRADFEQLTRFGSPITEVAATGDALVTTADQISLPDATLNYRAVSKETATMAEVQYVALSRGEGWQLGQSIALTQEEGQLFGNVGTGAYALADRATTLTVGSNGTRQLNDDWTLFGGVGLSQTAVAPAAASLIALSDHITSASAIFGLRRDQLGADQTASFAVQVSQDRRVLDGSALTTIPVGRDDGGVIVLEETHLDAAALSIVPTLEMTYEDQLDLTATIAYSASANAQENVLAVDIERVF